jgi:hypothetical protein
MWNPLGAGTWWTHVTTRDPYVTMAVPAVIARGPNIANMGRRARPFDDYRWGWSDAHDDLRICSSGGKYDSKKSCRKKSLHCELCSSVG